MIHGDAQKKMKEAQLLDERVRELRLVLAQGRKWAERLVEHSEPDDDEDAAESIV